MNEPHGTAIVCERHNGHTVAWVDAEQSRHVPAGYFIESWPQDGETHVGTLSGGYEIGYDGWGQKVSFPDAQTAALWCQHDAMQRQTRNRLIAYAMLGAMVSEWKEQGE